MKSLIAIVLVCACLGGCVGHSFDMAKLPPDELARQGDLQLAIAYADVRDVVGPEGEGAKRLQAELQTRKFPLAWEWEYIERTTVVPGMTVLGVTAVYGLSGCDTVGYDLIGDEVTETQHCKRGYNLTSITWKAGVVDHVIRPDGSVLATNPSLLNTRRPDAPLVDAARAK